MTLNMLGADHPLNGAAPQADLLAILARSDRADIGRAWNIFNERCFATEFDPGGTMLFILIDAVVPVRSVRIGCRTRWRWATLKVCWPGGANRKPTN